MTLQMKLERIVKDAICRLNDAHSLLSIAEGNMLDIDPDAIRIAIEDNLMKYTLKESGINTHYLTLDMFMGDYVLADLISDYDRRHLLSRALISAMNLSLDIDNDLQKLLLVYKNDKEYMHTAINKQMHTNISRLEEDGISISTPTIMSIMNMAHSISMELSLNFKDVYFYISSILISANHEANMKTIKNYIEYITRDVSDELRSEIREYLYSKIKHKINDIVEISDSTTVNVKELLVEIISNSVYYTSMNELITTLGSITAPEPLIFYYDVNR